MVNAKALLGSSFSDQSSFVHLMSKTESATATNDNVSIGNNSFSVVFDESLRFDR